MTSAPACWAIWGELNALLLSDPSTASYRQFCVDAYAVQHPGEQNRQAIQSVAAHLMSLYASVVLGLPVKSSHAAMGRAIAHKDRLQWMAPPSFDGSRTVVDTWRDRDRLPDAAREWAADAWAAWRPHHDRIRAWYQEL
jgi:hypothetical protein